MEKSAVYTHSDCSRSSAAVKILKNILFQNIFFTRVEKNNHTHITERRVALSGKIQSRETRRGVVRPWRKSERSRSRTTREREANKER